MNVDRMRRANERRDNGFRNLCADELTLIDQEDFVPTMPEEYYKRLFVDGGVWRRVEDTEVDRQKREAEAYMLDYASKLSAQVYGIHSHYPGSLITVYVPEDAPPWMNGGMFMGYPVRTSDSVSEPSAGHHYPGGHLATVEWFHRS